MGRTTSKGPQFWTHRVEQYRHGELTLREYCERHALKLSTFGRWRKDSSSNGPAGQHNARATRNPM